jgi:hypothetical protein
MAISRVGRLADHEGCSAITVPEVSRTRALTTRLRIHERRPAGAPRTREASSLPNDDVQTPLPFTQKLARRR